MIPRALLRLLGGGAGGLGQRAALLLRRPRDRHDDVAARHVRVEAEALDVGHGLGDGRRELRVEARDAHQRSDATATCATVASGWRSP